MMTEELVGFVEKQPAYYTETWLERRDVPAHRQPSRKRGWFYFDIKTFSWWVRVR